MTHTEVEVNRQGRVTIPAELRHELGLHAGSKLVASVQHERLVLERPVSVLARYQERLARAAAEAGYPSGGVADSLIADRRAAATEEKEDS